MLSCGCGLIDDCEHKKKRLSVNKTAGSGTISIANFQDQLGEVSSHVFLTEHKMKDGKRARKSSIIPEMVVKTAHSKLDSTIEMLTEINERLANKSGDE